MTETLNLKNGDIVITHIELATKIGGFVENWLSLAENEMSSTNTQPEYPGDLYISSLKHFASQHPELPINEAFELMIKDWDSESQKRDINDFRKALNWIRDNPE